MTVTLTVELPARPTGATPTLGEYDRRVRAVARSREFGTALLVALSAQVGATEGATGTAQVHERPGDHLAADLTVSVAVNYT